jgi:regulator of protease activity HflC (stomatin/prohibitin superfamily)
MRMILFFGGPFVKFVPDNTLQVIYHMGQYREVKGPGLITYNPFTQTLGPQVKISGRIKQYSFPDILARDVVPMKFRVNAVYNYNPLNGYPEVAAVVTQLSEAELSNIVETFMAWALLSRANQYDSSALVQQEVSDQVITSVRDLLNRTIAFLGLRVDDLRILKVELPPVLSDRLQSIAQRRASILAGTEFESEDFRKALITEVIERFAQVRSGKTMFNFSNLLESYAEEKRQSLPSRVIDNPPQPPRPDADDSAPPRKSRL